MGGNNRKKPKPRRQRPSGNRGALFVEGGVLSDWSPLSSPPSRGRKVVNGSNVKNSGSGSGKKSGLDSGRKNEVVVGKKKSVGNAIGYRYPQENAFVDLGENQQNNVDASSSPIVLIDSEKTPIIAYLDEGPVKENQSVEYMYDYTTSFSLGESSHRGLGFHDEVEANPDGIGSSSKMEENESGSSSFEEIGDMSGDVDFGQDAKAETGEDVLDEMSTDEENENPGYVLIGGTKIYTDDISDEDDEDEEQESSDEDSSDSEDSSETSESDGSSYSGSDVDDEVAEDYFEGIGGIGNVVNVDRLVGRMANHSSDSEENIDETMKKLGGIALQEASMEYGMKKPARFHKEHKRSIPVNYGRSSALDDLMLVKDPRNFSRKKKPVARFPESWPSEAGKSRRHRRMPGEKKKHRKELIAAKRQDRMVRRGVDLQKINLKLEKMVLDGVDMFSFQPMYPRDCTQLRKLASIYRWRSGCQGSGKKRFVTVVRTHHTCMPSSSDKIRLEQLIGANNVETNATKNAAGISSSTPIRSRSSRNKPNNNNSSSKEAKKSKTGKIGSYAAQPLSFVSSGNMTTEIIESKDASQESQSIIPNSVEYRSFEIHTTGFGSKMMAKMGYVEGGGLGKDGQGMSQPIEVFQRPKSLGLGADVPETSNGTPKNTGSQPKSVRRGGGSGGKSPGSNGRSVKTENNTNKVGSFERHTKGFGSKMMAKMGFVEGMGLGKDSQGIVNPLVAVRRPKARGLGATTTT